MSYATYTTKALVCGTHKRNTSDASYLLFTREAGMLFADARSVREEKSRQRYSLQDFSLIRVSLVKGKRGWKIGSVEAIKNYYQQAVGKPARGSVVNIFRHLRRFLRGEEVIADVFDEVEKGLEVLKDKIDNRPFMEMVISLKLMTALGYVDDKKIPQQIKSSSLEDVTRYANPELEKILNDLYMQAVAISHL